MPKYLILYSSDISGAKQMEATPEQMQRSMDEWKAWKIDADKVAKFDFGGPLQAAYRITPDGLTENNMATSGYSMIEADSKDEILEILQKHPYLMRPGSKIDLLEMITMPGMDGNTR